MKYEEFVAAVCKDIRVFLPERYTKAIIEPIHVDKVQKASYYGISVREENTGKGLSMDLAYWFSQVCEQERFGGKLFILPSSIHELILVPDDGEDVKGLKEIVSDVNDNSGAVTEEDFLSNSVYHYDAKLHRLTKM